MGIYDLMDSVKRKKKNYFTPSPGTLYTLLIYIWLFVIMSFPVFSVLYLSFVQLSMSVLFLFLYFLFCVPNSCFVLFRCMRAKELFIFLPDTPIGCVYIFFALIHCFDMVCQIHYILRDF